MRGPWDTARAARDAQSRRATQTGAGRGRVGGTSGRLHGATKTSQDVLW